MSAPAPVFILTCPTCGKKYQGDATKPNARYKCPADGAELRRPEPARPMAPPSHVTSSIHDKDETVRIEPPKRTHDETLQIQPPKRPLTGEISVGHSDETVLIGRPRASGVPLPPPPAPQPRATQEIAAPAASQRTTQEIESPAPPSQDRTQQLERSELPPMERTQQLDRSEIPLSRTTQPVESSAVPAMERTQQIDRSELPPQLSQRTTQEIDLSQAATSGAIAEASQESDSSQAAATEDALATRVLGSQQPAQPNTMIAGSQMGTLEEQATRMLGSSGAGAAVSPARQPEKPSMMARAGNAETMTPTIYEQRRSVVAMIQSGGTDVTAAMAGNKYEMMGKLGQGGVGEVLKVMDRDLKREVAMKLLLRQDSDESLIRFIEEAQATGQLEHPNIVPVHDLGVDAEGRVYFTLKYVQGVSLKQVVRGRNENAMMEGGHEYFRDRYTPLRLVEILVSVCQAVAYAHSKGIIHRDLKPDNIMLGKYGEVLVMDWGLAKVLDEKKPTPHDSDATVRISTSRAEDKSQNTMEGSIAGTPAYMAPEQAAGRISELDHRTDIYALGAMLYELLSGRPPYTGSNALKVVKDVIDGPPAALKSANAAPGFVPLPRELKAICEKAMAREPQDRYATASLLRDDLQAFLEHEPVSASPDSTFQRAAKWARRNRRQVQTSAASVAIVIAIVLGGWFGFRTYQIGSLLSEANTKLNAARDAYKATKPSTRKPEDNDAYQSMMWASAQGEKNRVFRAGISGAMEPLRHVLDISPQNARAKLLLAESYMEMWRLAVSEENTELARSTRAELERYAPAPSPFSDELNGFGSLRITFDPPDSEAFLFTFQTLRSKDKDGNDLAARLIPVPFDISARKPDMQWLEAERKRIENGGELPAERHSIFNLAGTAASRLGKGSVNVEKLPPGSYLVVASAPGRIEIRVPIRVARQGSVDRRIKLPSTDEAPAGFFYMAGGEAIVGGFTAGAPAPHQMPIAASFIYHDEISMGEYADFLQSLVKSGRGAEARQHLPKDFGKSLATLSAGGQLVPSDGGDPVAFAATPVRGVSYNDASAYVAWRAKRDGLPYRLPKDWEWEAACRGTDGRKYSWGDQPGKGLAVVTQGYGDTGKKISWKWENYKDESPWGIHNLAGGAAEWTMSKFDPKAKQEDPVFGQLAIRGNAWALPPVGLECSFRTSGQPDYFHPTIGFRLALDYPYVRTGSAEVAAVVHTH